MRNTILTEKHRPQTLDDVVGQSDIVAVLKGYVSDSTMPHLMFSGPPGVGKTTCAKALAKDIFGDKWKTYVLDANGSDDRGITFVRDVVKNFARTTSYDAPFKIIFLDEADAMTPAAQDALRRIMEDYASSCRFILSCNEPTKIIPAIHSRCAKFTFKKLSNEDISGALKIICDGERIPYVPGALESIAQRANGSMRDALNALSASPIPIPLDTTVEVSGDWRGIIKDALSGDIDVAELTIVDMVSSGVTGDKIFTSFYEAINESSLSDGAKNKLLVILGEYHYRCAVGASALIQGRCFLRHIRMEARK